MDPFIEKIEVYVIYVIGQGGDMDTTLNSFVLWFRKKNGLKLHIIGCIYRNELNIPFQKEAAIYLLYSTFS